jgi:hypothetical protein
MRTIQRSGLAFSWVTHVTAPFFPLSREDGRPPFSEGSESVTISGCDVASGSTSLTRVHTSSGVARNVAQPDAAWARPTKATRRPVKRMSAKRLAAMIRAIRMGETRDD